MTLTQELGEGVELAFTPGLAARDPQKPLAQALELPELVAKAGGKRFVVFFDVNPLFREYLLRGQLAWPR